MQATAGYLVGGSYPGAASMAATGADAGVHPAGFEPLTEKSAAGCVTIRPGEDVTHKSLPLLGAFSAKTFDPPPTPTPPLKKVLSGFRG